MGSEALAKATRRDIRRAYAPEASEEVLKFVDGVKQDLALQVAGLHNEVLAAQRQAVSDAYDDARTLLRSIATADYIRDLTAKQLARPTFFQRLRWLVTGRWL